MIVFSVANDHAGVGVPGMGEVIVHVAVTVIAVADNVRVGIIDAVVGVVTKRTYRAEDWMNLAR